MQSTDGRRCDVVGIIADKFVEDIIMEPIAIARHYLRTWFFVDLISSLPLDYIILALSPDANVTQMMHAGARCYGYHVICADDVKDTKITTRPRNTAVWA